MLFWLLLLLDIALSMLIGINLNIGILGSVVLSLLIYFVLCAISMALVGFLSLLLGGTDKFALKKKNKYEVIQHDTDYIKILNKMNRTETIPTTYLSNIVIGSTETPYLEVNIYNLTGWRAYWLWEVYNDTVEYILYLPAEEAVELCGL